MRSWPIVCHLSITNIKKHFLTFDFFKKNEACVNYETHKRYEVNLVAVRDGPSVYGCLAALLRCLVFVWGQSNARIFLSLSISVSRAFFFIFSLFYEYGINISWKHRFKDKNLLLDKEFHTIVMWYYANKAGNKFKFWIF